MNTGRGSTVDDKALYCTRTEGTLAATGLDGPKEEPANRAAWMPDDNPIFKLPNVVMTSHAARYSAESIRAVRETSAKEVALVPTGQTPRFPINADRLTNI